MSACYGMTQFEFDPNKDLKDYKVWMCDLAHFPKGLRPLPGYLWTDQLTYGQQYACEKLQVPESKGWDERIIDGYSYLAVIESDPAEVPAREEKYRENLKPLSRISTAFGKRRWTNGCKRLNILRPSISKMPTISN